MFSMAGKSWPAALAAVEGALTLCPLEAEYHHHRAHTLAILGRIDEGERDAPPGDQAGFESARLVVEAGEDLRIGRPDRRAASETVKKAILLFPVHLSLRAQAK